ETDFLRGYAATFSGRRAINTDRSGFGEELKQGLNNPEYGAWRVSSGMMGETIPKEVSVVSLDSTQRDRWGVPLLRIAMDYDNNDLAMTADFFDQFEEMFSKAG